MKTKTSREILKAIKADGWYEVNAVGSHHQFLHPAKKGKVTVQHPKKEITGDTLKSIERQSGITF
ncbi:MAG: type II toxin-antitoxin system HicA family toxin [Clostridiales bacterium]|jgi:predicted RNA binding protein YcfA (HicA-like mRNA interferase family)|nr:type II toxin-antitoxin system HicA family toxin [Clostridiales bacterium]